MKTFAFVALLALASATALPQTYDVESRRNVVDVVLNVIERARQWVRERGFDPYALDFVEGQYSFPLAGLFTARGSVSDLSVVGASNIVVNDIGFSLITQKLTFDVAIPEITASLRLAEGEISFLDRPSHRGLASGRLSIKNFRITGNAVVEVSGANVDVSDLAVEATLGGIESGLHINIIGYDVSTSVNNFLSNTLPNVLSNNSDYINRALQRAIIFLLDRIFSNIKTFAFGLLMLVACAAAFPQDSVADFGAERRDVADIIVSAIGRLRERIINRGLDPYRITRAEFEYVLVLPSVFSVNIVIENFSFDGLSNIVVNSISYSPLTSDLFIDVSMPSLFAIAGGISGEMTVLGRDITGSLSGILGVNGLGVSGSAKVSLLNPGVSVTDIKVDARLNSIQSALAIRVLDLDLSPAVDAWLTNLPANLSLYDDLINRGLARVIAILIEHYF